MIARMLHLPLVPHASTLSFQKDSLNVLPEGQHIFFNFLFTTTTYLGMYRDTLLTIGFLVDASFGKLAILLELSPHHILETIPFQTGPSLSTDETQSLLYYFQEHQQVCSILPHYIQLQPCLDEQY